MNLSAPLDLARQAAADYRQCYGDDLISIVVFGSAAGGDFQPKTSDVNLLITLQDASISALEKSDEVQRKWDKKRFARPLFVDPEYIQRSLDVFPVEFLNMQQCYSVVFGEDILAGISIEERHLWLQVERELKGKRLHLLQNWLEVKSRPKEVESLLRVSMRDFAACFRALLYLKKQEIPKDRQALFGTVGEVYGFEGRPFQRTLEAYLSGDRKRMQDVFPDYASAIRKLSQVVDAQGTQG